MSQSSQRLAQLDLSLFEAIKSQTTDNDKRSLLAVQDALGMMQSSYTYLEIGSYHGGSLQPHLVDERCERIFSIDKRPRDVDDARGFGLEYPDNSTHQMLEKLRGIPGADLDKLFTIDGDVSEIEAAKVTQPPDLCFIDGEHTDDAAWRDYEFCRKVMKPNGAIVFHDAMIIYNCLDRIIRSISAAGEKFRAYNIPDVIFVVEFGDFSLHRSKTIGEMLLNNHVGYLRSLQCTDQYRHFANRRPFRILRELKMKLTGKNITK